MGRLGSLWVAGLMLLALQGCSRDLHRPPKAAQAPRPTSATSTPVVAPTPKETRALLDANQFAELDRRFSEIQRSYQAGYITDEDLRAAFRAFYPTDLSLEQKYTAWIAQFPKSYVARLARGIYYQELGRQRRGGHYISETTDEQLQSMEATFAKALLDLEASLELNDKPLLSYAQEMDIARTLGADERARTILEAAIKVDPNNIVVREKYMGILEPRWGGSFEKMQAFVEESRREGLSARNVGLLEGMIFEDRAHIEAEARDYVAAERDFRKAAELGNEDCLSCFAGTLVHLGKFADAIPIYSRSLIIDPNDVDTLRARSDTYMQAGMMREAIDDLRAAAEAGSADAQSDLGVQYMQGVPGVLAPNPALGTAWFKKAAAQGNLNGQRNLEIARTQFGPNVDSDPPVTH